MLRSVGVINSPLCEQRLIGGVSLVRGATPPEAPRHVAKPAGSPLCSGSHNKSFDLHQSECRVTCKGQKLSVFDISHD